jgi:hypothetical protein
MITAQQTEKLLKGSHTFSYLGFSMLLMRMRMLYANDSSPSTLQTCTDEICNFLNKFKNAMGSDYTAVQQL